MAVVVDGVATAAVVPAVPGEGVEAAWVEAAAAAADLRME